MLVSKMNEIAKRNDTSIKRMRNAINREIGKATPELRSAGIDWYESAYNDCAELALNSQYNIHQIAGAVAHLSPRQRWSKNIEYAKMVVDTGNAPCLSRSVAKAKEALVSDNPIETFSPTALKTRSFYWNLLKDYNHVTVDMWAARAALQSDDAEKILARSGMYQTISHAYVLAGKDNDLSPAETQAVAWCAIRNNHV